MKNILSKVRDDHKKLFKGFNSEGRAFVIVTTKISPRKNIYMVQSWTKAMIEAGLSINSDRTLSKFVEIL